MFVICCVCSRANGSVHIAGVTGMSRSYQNGSKTSFRCPVTVPKGKTYTDAEVAPLHDHGTASTTNPDGTHSLGNYGNDALSTGLYPEGKVVFKPGGPGFVLEDGALSMKFFWWRLVPGRLTIDGRRLDGAASPLRATIPDGYGDIGFQSTALLFSTPGCWEVTGHVGNRTLTFVTLVEKIGNGPGNAESH
jgi:hypothetical protein